MKPGTELYVTQSSGINCRVSVVSVGRRWAVLDAAGWRLNLETMQVYDDFRRVGMAYPSEQAYRDQEAVRDAWSEFQRLVTRKSPDNMSVEQIAQATAWLGVGE